MKQGDSGKRVSRIKSITSITMMQSLREKCKKKLNILEGNKKILGVNNTHVCVTRERDWDSNTRL